PPHARSPSSSRQPRTRGFTRNKICMLSGRATLTVVRGHSTTHTYNTKIRCWISFARLYCGYLGFGPRSRSVFAPSS
ncbi:hypothetical protein FRC06_009987, partial [Ceratobasidium sp. 370]